MTRKKISVAMAAYNGEKYIQKQIDSILPQLESEDELVISLDESQDQTKSIIESYQDHRIRLIEGPKKGAIQNFEHVIAHCHNEIIFLCDQDDIWNSKKVETVLPYFDDQMVQVVLHDAIVFEDEKVIVESFFAHRNTKIGQFHNVMKNGYLGCCMAFRKSLTSYILPFPKKIPMHDMWIGLVGERVGKNVLCDECLTYYRRHGENVTSMHHAGLTQMIRWRINLLQALHHVKK